MTLCTYTLHVLVYSVVIGPQGTLNLSAAATYMYTPRDQPHSFGFVACVGQREPLVRDLSLLEP